MDGPGIIGFVAIGLIAGYVADRLHETGRGLFSHLVVGIIGALIGGIVASAIGVPPPVGFVVNLVVATLGAIIILYALRKLGGKQRN